MCFSVCVHSVPLYPAHKGSSEDYQKSDCIPLTRFIVTVIGMFNQLFHAVSLYFRCGYGAERLKKEKDKKNSDQILIKVCRSSAAIEYAYRILCS